jgi:hypothetical protein
MDRKGILAAIAVALAFVCAAKAARADVLVRTGTPPAPAKCQVQAIERAADRDWCGAYSPFDRLPSSSERADDEETAPSDVNTAGILAAILLIPPPINLVTPIPTSQPDTPHAVVTGGPGLQVQPLPGGANSQILHTEGAPEPTSFVLAAIGGGLAAAGAWYRRRKSRRGSVELPATPEVVAA